MQTERQKKVAEQLAHIGAEFFAIESNRQSMITVTRANVSPDLANATIFFTVLPDEQQDNALKFAKRMRKEFREFAKKHTALRRIPFFDFEIDYGEKHRQHIDTISQNANHN